MARNRSEKHAACLLSYARRCRDWFDNRSAWGIGAAWDAIPSDVRLSYLSLSRKRRMLRIFSEHGTAEEKQYRGP